MSYEVIIATMAVYELKDVSLGALNVVVGMYLQLFEGVYYIRT